MAACSRSGVCARSTRACTPSTIEHRKRAEVKTKWNRKPCGCVKAELPLSGRVMIRCTKHRGKPSKRALAYFDADGIVRRDTAVQHVTPDPYESALTGLGLSFRGCAGLSPVRAEPEASAAPTHETYQQPLQSGAGCGR